jgi:hypothetical protein
MGGGEPFQQRPVKKNDRTMFANVSQKWTQYLKTSMKAIKMIELERNNLDER